MLALRARAEAGEFGAQYRSGRAYLNGCGVTLSRSEAAQWLRKAADREHARAQKDLGTSLFAGGGVPQDDAAAVRWWRRAAVDDGLRWVEGLCTPPVVW